jgi:type II secretory pathway pseudopilin PulG
MIVVAIVAILAVVIVPMFTGEAKKVKSKTEVSAMFAELAAKQERYKSENNVYLAVAECPAPASSTPKAVTACQTVGAPWLSLGVVPPEQNLRCSYEVYIGDSATMPTQPTGATSVTIPPGYIATSWYMMHARCDMDNDGTLAHFVSSSFDGGLSITAEGE